MVATPATDTSHLHAGTDKARGSRTRRAMQRAPGPWPASPPRRLGNQSSAPAFNCVTAPSGSGSSAAQPSCCDRRLDDVGRRHLSKNSRYVPVVISHFSMMQE